jgi:spermidine synthase
MWRNDTLIASWRRFHEVFPTVLYYGSDEHEWAFVTGRRDQVADPGTAVAERLGSTALRASTMDAETLRGGSVAPYRVRVPAGSPA